MSAISTFFTANNVTATRAAETGTAPAQGGVLTHTVTNRKTHTYYYGVQSAVFTPSGQSGVSGTYSSSRKVCITSPTITQSSTGTVYGKNSNTGSIKTYGSTAAYTNRYWETSSKTTSTTYASSTYAASASTPKITYSSVCVTCR